MSTANRPHPMPAAAGSAAAAQPRAPVVVGLVQINNSFSGQNYLPYSVALLQTYVQKMSADPGRYAFLPPLYKRVRIADAVEALKDADLVGFSTYVWNGRISLEIARRLKAAKPGMTIVFGGPHVPDQPEAFLRANPQIDLAVHNEGERTFLNLLEAFPDRSAWQSLPGVSFVRPDGSFVRNPNIERVRDLDEIPSPFLEGAFDSIMAANPQESWIGLWETNRGCPVPLHLLRLGIGDGGQGHQVRRGAPLSRGRLVRREEDRVHLLLRCQLRHPEARRRHRQVCRGHQAGHRLSGRSFGAEHQERDRAGLRDPEDPVRRRPEQGRGALHAERRHDDARRRSSATTSRSAPTWSCSGASPATGSRPIPT